jgi:glutamate 5-kinase
MGRFDPDAVSDTAPPQREILRSVGRMVVKVGTRVLTGADGGFDDARLRGLALQIGGQHRAGKQILLVSSGAVGMGAQILGFGSPPVTLEDRQACAAVGQSRLMHHYESAFGEQGIVAAQVLLTDGDFDDRTRYLNLRSTLTTLLHRRVVPIINENDAVSVAELAWIEGADRRVFGDNDSLSALVATKLEAELLVLLTDVEGLFDRDPSTGEAQLVRRIGADQELERGTGDASPWGRGGMRSKVEACRMAARAACHAVIAPGYVPDVLDRLLAGEELGSWFPARRRVGARRRWIAFATRPQGVLVIDAGALEALSHRGASLLAAGIRQVKGTFRRGDVVELRTEDGRVAGRGITFCDSDTARRWSAGERPEGIRNHHALVHRDHLVLEEWTAEGEG